MPTDDRNLRPTVDDPDATDLVQSGLLSLIHMVRAHCKRRVPTGCGWHYRWWTGHSWGHCVSRTEQKIAVRMTWRYCCCWERRWGPTSRWRARSSLPTFLVLWHWIALHNHSKLLYLLAPARVLGPELNMKRNKWKTLYSPSHNFVPSRFVSNLNAHFCPQNNSYLLGLKYIILYNLSSVVQSVPQHWS